ncbi:hypothetical protein [Streptomyces sp. NRRL S-237]|uniref:hypothetical protein n=1 Tax=Streptomyces sp. NRRL S-237 TaxID=1463895 RepID=UPI00068B0295|nr:hypothetical protein [Streptomyces sp. NRRL S-237]
MFDRAVRTVAVAGLALLPVLGGAAPGAAAAITVGVEGHGLTGAAANWPSGDARLVVPLHVVPGTYAPTATGHGRTVAAAHLTVAPSDGAHIRRFGILRPGAVFGDPVRPGSTVTVLLADDDAVPGEDSLVATSPAFTKDVRIRTDGPDDPLCKCDDGSTLYTGHTTLRDDVPPGTYPLTVVSHHGLETHTAQIVLAGRPVATGMPRAVWGGIAAVLATLAGAGALVRRRRRPTTDV